MAQAEIIQRHLAMVFVHDIDPMTEKGSAELKKLLNSAHTGKVQVMPNEATMRC